MGEPFFADGRTTNPHIEEWKKIMPEVDEVVEKVGKKYHAPVIPYQKMFDEAFRRAPENYWIWDGIHPTYAGHELMADELLRTYTAFYGAPADGN